MSTQNSFAEQLRKYELARDETLNPGAVRQFEAARPSLSAVQNQIVIDLQKDGLSVVGFDQLFEGNFSWSVVEEEMRRFSSSETVRTKAKAYRENFGGLASKEYIIRAYEKGIVLPPDNVWLRLGLSEKMLNVVNSAMGLWSKLSYMDLWYTPPVADPRDAVASQQWHRDPEDEKLVKVFLYCVDVDASTGPFEYYKGSFIGGRYGDVWPLPKQALLNLKGSPEVAQNHAERKAPPGLETIPASEHKVCTGPAGTLVFCNSTGIHRGGFAVDNPRILAHWTFNTPASMWPRRFSADLGGEFSEAARFAVTA